MSLKVYVGCTDIEAYCPFNNVPCNPGCVMLIAKYPRELNDCSLAQHYGESQTLVIEEEREREPYNDRSIGIIPQRASI